MKYVLIFLYKYLVRPMILVPFFIWITTVILILRFIWEGRFDIELVTNEAGLYPTKYLNKRVIITTSDMDKQYSSHYKYKTPYHWIFGVNY